MQTSKETLSPTRVRLTVEVPFDEFKPNVDAAYRRVARQVRVPGFRPGKAPARILDQRLGRSHILDEALQEALPGLYSRAVEQETLAVLSRPEVDVTRFEDGDQLVFTAEMDIRPDITLPDYEGMEVTVDDATVGDETVDEQVEALRDRFASLIPAERPAEPGDFLSIDFDATVDGQEVPGAKMTGYSYELGSGSVVAGLDEALAGVPEGETRTFESELVAGDFAGRTAEVTVTARSVKRKELPDLDDDFATTASEFDTLDELRVDIREKALRTRRLQQGLQARDRVLEKLVELTEVPIPDSVVDEEVAGRQQGMQRDLQEAGLTLETFLSAQGKTAEEFDADLRAGARRSVKAQFVLDEVVRKEQLGIEEQELTEHVVRLAQRAGVPPDAYAEQVVQSGGLQSVAVDVLRGKALASVLQAARVVDASGNVVDLEAVGRPTAVAAGVEGDEEAEEVEGDEEAEEVEGVEEAEEVEGVEAPVGAEDPEA